MAEFHEEYRQDIPGAEKVKPYTLIVGDSNNIIITGDGSASIYVPSLDEHYHSRFGALTESVHIFINSGLATVEKDEIHIFEAGFGTGLNALLTAVYAAQHQVKVFYLTAEKYPLDSQTLSRLNYGTLAGEGADSLFEIIHDAPWNQMVQLSEWFSIEKRIMDLTMTAPSGKFDIVYFDAFGPDKQPEMWTKGILAGITSGMEKGSLFVTYSAKGELKRILRSLGFEVAHIPGPPGKRVITRAVKK